MYSSSKEALLKWIEGQVWWRVSMDTKRQQSCNHPRETEKISQALYLTTQPYSEEQQYTLLCNDCKHTTLHTQRAMYGSQVVISKYYVQHRSWNWVDRLKLIYAWCHVRNPPSTLIIHSAGHIVVYMEQLKALPMSHNSRWLPRGTPV